MLKHIAAIALVMGAATATTLLIQNDARGIAASSLPMAAKIIDRLPASDLQVANVEFTTVAVVQETDLDKRLTVLTKTSN